jgi:DNA-3-methyladenine glycosylase II
LSRITFSLDPTPPFRLDLTAWALRRRPQNEVDFWDGEAYRRVLVIRRKPVLVHVTQTGGVDRPRLEVTAIGLYGDAKNALVLVLERLLGLRIDLTAFYALAAKQRRLHELSTRFRGMKPPRFPTVWESIVNGVACQQLSLTVGIILLNRLSSACGLAFPGRNGVSYAFPRPEDLAVTAPETVRSLGFSGAKTRTLIELSREISEKRLDLESLTDLKNDRAVSELVELRGVGRWTAEYAMLRGMGRLDLFPGDDIGARNNLEQWMRLRKPLDYDRVAHVLRRWKPFGGLVYFHLLLDRLAKAGYLQPNTGSCLPRTRIGESKAGATHQQRNRDDQIRTSL